MNLAEQKAEIRKTVREKMRGFVDDGISAQLCARLIKTPEWQQAKKVLLYAPLEGEVDVLPLLKKQGKDFYFPSIQGDELHIRKISHESDFQASHFGIREPKDHCEFGACDQLDLVIVPGLAFDEKGGRLGRGKGFYDRFLSSLSQKTHTVALAFPFQMFPKIPMEAHDVRINRVIN